MTSLTVIIPCKNESGTIESVARSCLENLKSHSLKNRIIIVDDGSEDDTFEKASFFQNQNPEHVKVIRHFQSLGVGAAYKSALQLTQTDFVTWLPGDGEADESILPKLLDKMGKKEVLLTFPEKSWPERAIGRILLSYVFQKILNLTFFNRVRYFNGSSLYPTEFVKNVPIKSNGFFFHSEILIRVLRRYRPQYEEIPYRLIPRSYGRSKALNLRNFFDVILNFLVLRFELLFWK